MGPKKRILIIEDEPLVRRALKDALIENGNFDISEVGEGGKALAMIEEFHPDLALVDIDIPNMDGVTLAKELAARKLTERTKVMYLTNASDLSTISDATTIEGVLGYFFKADWDVKDVIKEIDQKLKEADRAKERKEKTEALKRGQAAASEMPKV